MDTKGTTLTNIEADKAADVLATSELTEEARALLTAEISPADYIDALASADLLPDALRFLAHALPKEDAVHWACQAAESATRDDADLERSCLEAARRWAAEPVEDHRQEALAAAEEADFSGAAGWAAAAAGWSGGSMAPPDLEEVPPPAHLTGTAVTSALLLASVAGEPHLVEATQQKLLTSGLELAAKPSA